MNSGIYRIINIINNDFYIGSAVNFKNRESSHFNNLKVNKHINIHLQRAFNKYGIENFKFEIISKCPKEYLLKLEQWFLDNMKPEYNICKIAGSVLGRECRQSTRDKISASNKGRIISKESRLKISNSLKGRKNKPCSIETKNKISKFHKGKCWSSKEDLMQRTIKSLEVTRKKIDYIDNKNQIIKTYNSLSEAAKDLNIDYKRISMCVTGVRKHYKQMKFRYSINQ